jgi:hypothetical protein
MAKKEKLFRLTIELEEVIADESSLFPLFINGQVCSGIDEIKATLESFNARLTEFLDKVLIPNQEND